MSKYTQNILNTFFPEVNDLKNNKTKFISALNNFVENHLNDKDLSEVKEVLTERQDKLFDTYKAIFVHQEKAKEKERSANKVSLVNLFENMEFRKILQVFVDSFVSCFHEMRARSKSSSFKNSVDVMIKEMNDETFLKACAKKISSLGQKLGFASKLRATSHNSGGIGR